MYSAMATLQCSPGCTRLITTPVISALQFQWNTKKDSIMKEGPNIEPRRYRMPSSVGSSVTYTPPLVEVEPWLQHNAES